MASVSVGALKRLVGTKVEMAYRGSDGRTLTCVGTLMWVSAGTQACVWVPSGYVACDVDSVAAVSPSTGPASDPH